MLTSDEVATFRTEGWIAPLDLMPTDEAARVLDRLEAAEAEYPELLHAEHRNNAHLTFPFLADLAGDERIVSYVEALIGADITLWSSVLFIKEPDSLAYVSWHQDAKYMALEPDNFVTAWIALTPSVEATGCVAVIPGSHRSGPMPHEDTFAADNILTRGQRVNVDESAAVNLELQPGQMSLHHPWLVHGSRPNRSTARRVGIAMQAYLGGDVRPTRGEHHVMHVAGAPVLDGFVEAPRPLIECGAAGNAARDAANKAFADVLYDGAVARRKL